MSELQDLSALIRANTPLIVIETQDEGRIVELFRQTLMHVWRALHRWSITEGLRRIDLDREDDAVGPPDASSALQMMPCSGVLSSWETFAVNSRRLRSAYS